MQGGRCGRAVRSIGSKAAGAGDEQRSSSVVERVEHTQKTAAAPSHPSTPGLPQAAPTCSNAGPHHAPTSPHAHPAPAPPGWETARCSSTHCCLVRVGGCTMQQHPRQHPRQHPPSQTRACPPRGTTALRPAASPLSCRLAPSAHPSVRSAVWGWVGQSMGRFSVEATDEMCVLIRVLQLGGGWGVGS